MSLTDHTTAAQATKQETVLTDGDIRAITDTFGGGLMGPIQFARAIESALLSKLRAPVADERAAFEVIVKRLGGDCMWRPGYGYVSSTTRLYQNFWQQARAALASAHVAREEIPPGYALLPVKQTPEMHNAVMELLYAGMPRSSTQLLLDAYVRSAPAAPQASEAVKP